ncbi:nucleotide sugar dehydrogenase [Trujillonella endophytica]|uniref:UDP-glucose 6-dehydrogenase n=1 Tax=Trujillonella endophytica TaxID=673521 RepID=A0A1H8W0R4_9ACTN|nr:nucleotide sugar dehydrogenase [Trujillella endophytica]SEP21190.1 GDP-mannose 6-dehydrogenase [Trujillella endophytica]
MTSTTFPMEGMARASSRALTGISVFGLGYVGSISSACFASRGHRVVGVDVDVRKLDLLRQGMAPVIEAGLGDMVHDAVGSGLLSVTDAASAAVSATDMSLVCVATPSLPGGGLSTAYLEAVSSQIGAALATKTGWHTVVYRSTMLPGTCETVLIPLLERASGKRVGVDFGVCVNPEFLREGTSVRDFFEPPKTVVGYTEDRSAGLVVGLYEGLPGPRFLVPLGVAEMVKYVDNCFHALKVDFANEIGAICVALGLDSHAVMDVFLSDTKLNLSGAYLRPGFAFGGSCLPKDVRALTHAARRHDVEIPVIANILPSNEAHLHRALDTILALGKRRIGMFGLSFKSGTDDLRESPMVELAERLVGKGCDVRIHDENVSLSRLTGSNKAHIDERLPHLAELLAEDRDTVAQHGEVLLVATKDAATLDAVERAPAGTVVLDLVHVPGLREARHGCAYVGLSW